MLANLFLQVSLLYGIPIGLLDSVCFIESSHNSKAYIKNDGGSPTFGICGLKYGTAKLMGFKGKAKELFKPEVNIYYAGKYLGYQLKRYKGDYARAITAYNQGGCREHGGSKYFAKVINHYLQQSRTRGTTANY